jgi:hypothetical protein
MPTFSVPSGCRDAMTKLHNAHSERYNKVVNRLKDMHANQKEDHKMIAAFMDTHRTLHGAVGKALAHSSSDEMPDTVRNALETAHTHTGDVYSSLVRGQRGPGVGRKVVEDKPVGKKLAGQKVDPQKHLNQTIMDITKRFPEPKVTPKPTK